jgi:hypothetical protein
MDKKVSQDVQDFFNQFDKPFKYQAPPCSVDMLKSRLTAEVMMKYFIDINNFIKYDQKVKISRVLKEFNISTKDGLIDGLNDIFSLDFEATKNIAMKHRELANAISKELKSRVRSLSRTIGGLKALEKGQKAYSDFAPLNQTIESLEFDLNLYQSAATVPEKTKTLFDKSLNISDQKQNFWNVCTHKAIELINKNCHDASCKPPACTETHKKAITATAQILKTLYPKVWKENIETIEERIKQKNYRQI